MNKLQTILKEKMKSFSSMIKIKDANLNCLQYPEKLGKKKEKKGIQSGNDEIKNEIYIQSFGPVKWIETIEKLKAEGNVNHKLAIGAPFHKSSRESIGSLCLHRHQWPFHEASSGRATIQMMGRKDTCVWSYVLYISIVYSQCCINLCSTAK